ncbi:dihydroneopterin triphosphate diphosphatase [Acerihabitans sp. TG2]|uniref:dihydroneopterin triphosphate diphosphatase n=1 Tax=Acerihabitans sp. TG2 TaxID=3096008 RepID=UPI002B232BC9|nr:dihydroneopterin triphosphate diphosphatase [Acerihabitans sp. TG2]MEA9392968.1 dihydroneopterin triphosphate diphosphatase [Acerihabitans sp. TG2]
MAWKRPVSALIVIYAGDSGRVLMMQRRDDTDFWQSVTGSLEGDETPAMAAKREVAEETGINIDVEGLTLRDCKRCIEFEIFSHLRHRYAPGVTRNTEYWFSLTLPSERTPALSEHLAFRWLPATQAALLTKSWSNRQAIEEFVIYPA